MCKQEDSRVLKSNKRLHVWRLDCTYIVRCKLQGPLRHKDFGVKEVSNLSKLESDKKTTNCQINFELWNEEGVEGKGFTFKMDNQIFVIWQSYN
jgi:hypothetical protein